MSFFHGAETQSTKYQSREITWRLRLISSIQVNNCELKKLVEMSRTLIKMKVSYQLLLPVFFFLSLRCPRHRRLLVIVPVSPSVKIPIIHSDIIYASCYNYSFEKTAESKFPSSCQDSKFTPRIYHSITPSPSTLAYKAFTCSVRIPAWALTESNKLVKILTTCQEMICI